MSGSASGGERGGRARRFVALAAAVALTLVLGYLYIPFRTSPVRGADEQARSIAAPDAASAVYVGAAACASCHAAQSEAWRGSQHHRAMQAASRESVLAPFGGESFSAGGMRSVFSRDGERFMVRTEGADGRLGDHEVAYTLGVWPLQQYLIPMPDGGMQALGIAWDARPREQGGQRWFHLQGQHPPKPGDELHWTGRQANWNFMCAECHVTQFMKQFDATTRRYASTWAETGVSCEACHGPGSRHLAWAGKAPGWRRFDDDNKGLMLRFDERRGVHWQLQPDSGNAVRSPAASGPAKELAVCARCHSHRSTISDAFEYTRPLLDTHVVSLLEAGLFWPDGQMRAEVYNLAPFMQSKMYRQGVSCSDCHEPHSQQLRAPSNAVCFQCHAPARFESPEHHFHRLGSTGAQCAACHMPTTTYMSIDPRHDHFIQVPRPDLALRLATPDACTRCHSDKTTAWAAQQALRWFPHLHDRAPPAAATLQAADAGEQGALQRLQDLMTDPGRSAIVRASALARLPADLEPSELQRVAQALSDSDPLVRHAAVEALADTDPVLRATVLPPLLDDPVRAIRIAAARGLAAVPVDALAPRVRTRLESGLAEYVEVQRFNADRPESYNNLGTLYADRGDWVQAEAAFKTAIEIEPRLAVSSLNLADVYRATGREQMSEALIRGVLQAEPHHAAALHALGLSLLRQRKTQEALHALREATRQAPRIPHFSLVYALVLEDDGHEREAVVVLEDAIVRHPGNRELLKAMVGMLRRTGDAKRAERYAQRL